MQFVLFRVSYKRHSVQQRGRFRRQKVLHQEVVLKVVIELGFMRNIFISSCMSPVMPKLPDQAELRLVGQQSDKDSEDPADFLLSGHRFL